MQPNGVAQRWLGKIEQFRVSRKDLQVAFDGWVKGLRKAGEGEKFAVAMAFSSDQGITLSERDPANTYALPAAVSPCLCRKDMSS